MTFTDFLKSRVASGLLTIILVIVCFIAIRILIEKHQVDSEIAKLQAEANSVKQDNTQLQNLIGYLNTPDYTDTQAREQLNLKKNGEYVVALPDGGSDDSPAGPASNASQSNLKQWFNYFFPTP